MGQARSSGARITPQDRAILDMKLQRDKLRQYQKKVETVAQREQEMAKEALAVGNKSKALLALRRKKYQESLLVKTDAQLETLQNLVSTVEFSLIEKDVLYGLTQGNLVLKEIHKEMNIESVEKLMGETADALAYQKELDELLMSRMSADEEEDVQHQLAALQAEQEAPTKTVDPLASISLPDVPTGALPISQPTTNQQPQKQESSPVRELVAA